MSYFTTEFTEEKPYAEAVVLKDGVTALGKVRTAGEVLRVNYDSEQWESTLNLSNKSYLDNPALFTLTRVEPKRDPAEQVVVEIAEKPEEESSEGEEPVAVNVVNVVEEKPEAPKPTPSNRRKTTRK